MNILYNWGWQANISINKPLDTYDNTDYTMIHRYTTDN